MMKPPRTSLSCDLHEVSAACVLLPAGTADTLHGVTEPTKYFQSTGELITCSGDCIFPFLQRGGVCFEVAGAVAFANRANKMTWEENDCDVPSQCRHDYIHQTLKKQQPNPNWQKHKHSEVKAGKLRITLKNSFCLWPLAFLWYRGDPGISCEACLA